MNRTRRTNMSRGAAEAARAEVEARLHELLLELLRALARGRSTGEAAEALAVFVDLSARARIPWGASIERTVRRCDRRIEECAAASDLDHALFELGRAALLLTTEALSDDPLAVARRATRSDALHRAILRFVHACEREAQGEGWSYLGLLQDSIDAAPAN